MRPGSDRWSGMDRAQPPGNRAAPDTVRATRPARPSGVLHIPVRPGGGRRCLAARPASRRAGTPMRVRRARHRHGASARPSTGAPGHQHASHGRGLRDATLSHAGEAAPPVGPRAPPDSRADGPETGTGTGLAGGVFHLPALPPATPFRPVPSRSPCGQAPADHRRGAPSPGWGAASTRDPDGPVRPSTTAGWPCRRRAPSWPRCVRRRRARWSAP